MKTLRLAIVGALKGPDLFKIVEIIGTGETLKRINKLRLEFSNCFKQEHEDVVLMKADVDGGIDNLEDVKKTFKLRENGDIRRLIVEIIENLGENDNEILDDFENFENFESCESFENFSEF